MSGEKQDMTYNEILARIEKLETRLEDRIYKCETRMVERINEVTEVQKLHIEYLNTSLVASEHRLDSRSERIEKKIEKALLLMVSYYVLLFLTIIGGFLTFKLS